MPVTPQLHQSAQRLSASEISHMLSSGAIFTVTIRDGNPIPLFILQGRNSALLQRLRNTLGFGSIYTWDIPELEVRGVADCLQLVEFLGDSPPFEGELLQVYRAWKSLVLYLSEHPDYSVVEVQQLMSAMNPRHARFSL